MPNQRVNLTLEEMNEIAEHGSALKLHESRLFQLEKNLALTDKQVERCVSDIDSEKGTRARMNIEILNRIDNVANKADERREEFNAQFYAIRKVIWLAIGGAGLLNILLGFGIAIWAIYKK